MTYKILIVDDEPANLRLLERVFRSDYQIYTALTGNEALEILRQHDVALIITDQRMPEMTGVELLMRAAQMRPQTIRIILTGYTDVNTLVDALNSGVVYKYVTKPWVNTDLTQTVVRALEFYETNKLKHDLSLQNERLSNHLNTTGSAVIHLLADLINAKNEYAHGHARRTSAFATAVGRRLEMSEDELEQLTLAAFFHDVGRIEKQNDSVREADVMSNNEHRIAEFHSERSAYMLSMVPDLNQLAVPVRHYREHFDGGGYPDGLNGERIPLHSRIIAVADAYDEMTGSFGSRIATSHEEAVAKLLENAGTLFDPSVVASFCEIEALGQIRRVIEQDLTGMLLLCPQISTESNELPLADALQKIKTTPMLAMEVLRMSNSLNPETPTAQLIIAATKLGEQRLQLLLEEYALPPSDPEMQIWVEFSLRRAITAQLLAAHTDLMNPDEAYTLGLLHDIGEVLLSNLFPEEMCSIKQLNENTGFYRKLELFGVESAQISQWMLEACGLPLALTSAISTHNKLMQINTPAALIMRIANRIAKAEEENTGSAVDALGAEVLTLLRLSRNDLNRIYDRAKAISEQLIETQHENFELAV